MIPIPFGLSWLKLGLWALAAAAAVTAYLGWRGAQREIGRQEVRAEWAAEREALKDQALQEAQANAKETLRRMDRQQENQRAQDAQLAAARADAARNAADADRVREQSAAAARQWSARLADSPTAADLAAAAEAIAVLTDVRRRLDAAASELATYADAARAAGEKCQADYDALTSP